ncbi:type II toxin-antitoxin system RelE/ParE family toxin [Pseudomonas putida]|uniref:type II toxin-antitoxin system RelE family toxin n=1 Tax=Pseudomonas putida TaxID=303 RepID=UPI00383A1FCC
MSSLHKQEQTVVHALEFQVKAKKEFDKLPGQLRLQLLKKLKERLSNPRVEKDRLSGMPDCYKIKLKSWGYRLVYQVIDQRVVVTVIAVGKRERGDVYDAAHSRLM